MPSAYLSLGSNLTGPAGTPRQTLDAALTKLNSLGKVLAPSSYHSTAPVGYLDQPDFLNAAAILETSLEPQALLTALLNIEQSFGRDRSCGIPNGPRTLDLDLLLYDNLILNTPSLQLPHPRMADRAFVLVPLAEIAPSLIHPILHKSISELRDSLRTRLVTKDD
jgi:2-amino-4-hydroxy-6-hydroxymethyldihydropteridine diphosphokinase